ncbi:MAG: hypothetical protein KatS3mg014_0766 [Actinomycetota bacterium]|nr:MAG: hypothetical protein KatS3mg014_0766 [Actinomycetota bacterium]
MPPPSLARWLALAVATALTLTACGRSDAGRPSPGSGSSSSAGGAGLTPAPLVDPDDIISGGPPPDGIPPIDEPKFLAPDEVDFLEPQEPVLAVEVNGDARAYPLQIMIWHEIVNDTIGGTPITVTYCPLCNTGIAFERPTIDGELLDFGTSGKLYNSNLVMYDRQTETYWSQATGLAILGPLTGERLTFVPARILSFADWKAANPDGLVLSKDTGYRRPYGENPYVGYDSSGTPFLFSGRRDTRLGQTDRVLGLVIGGDVVAFPYAELRSRAVGDWAAVMAEVGGRPVLVMWKAGTTSALDEAEIAASKDVGAVAAFDPRIGGRRLTFEARAEGVVDLQTGSTWSIAGIAVAGPLQGKRLRPLVGIDSFWFDWAAFHPETRIYGAP